MKNLAKDKQFFIKVRLISTI